MMLLPVYDHAYLVASVLMDDKALFETLVTTLAYDLTL